MRFDEIFSKNSGPHISFEVFPPKTDAAMQSLLKVLPDLVALGPTFMTVTYGAMGSTRARTLEIAALIKQQYQMECACHLTCVGSTRADIDRLLTEIRQSKIENIVALRGDPPQGETAFRPPPDGYSHANELVAHIHRFAPRHDVSGFGVAVAGYPEKHIEAKDLPTDLVHLAQKVAAGADVVITQLFYDNAHYFSYVRAVRSMGVLKPIVPGLLPILSAKQVRRITGLCGSKVPPALQAELEQAGDDDSLAEEIGVRHCVSQATELLERGVPGIHFYVLNKSSHMKQIFHMLGPVVAAARKKKSLT